MRSVTFTIPKNIPTGQYVLLTLFYHQKSDKSRYLVRIEHIALHVAQSYGGAQFYVACAQLDVTDGGNGTPGPLVSIPGVYTGYVCTNVFLLVLAVINSKRVLVRILFSR